MSSPRDRLPESMYSEPSEAKSFIVLLSAKTENSVFLKQRKMPFTVLEMDENSFPFLEPPMITVARRILGKTLISITEKKALSGKPWIARYGKSSVGEALTSLVGEIFSALPDSESVLVFSGNGEKWRLVGYRLSPLAHADSTKTGLARILK